MTTVDPSALAGPAIAPPGRSRRFDRHRMWVVARAEPGLAAAGRSFLSIAVEDDGPGLPPDKRADALKRGLRLDETKPGSGLGLSIVAETAAMYQGSVQIGDAAGGGLRAVLQLPAAT